MYRVILKTSDFLNEFLEIEINKFYKKDIKKISNEFYEVDFLKDKDLFDFVLNMIYYSRTVESIFLEVSDFDRIEELKEKGFEIKNLNVGKNIFRVVDLVGFDLVKRNYMLNKSVDAIDSRVIVFGLYLLGIDRKKKAVSIIDPYANSGDIILESSMFNPRSAFNVKKRFDFNVCKIFKFIAFLPKENSNNGNYTGIVLDNNTFKKLKENIAFSSQKIKVSQFDFTWLDVKFKKGDFDFVISAFPKFKNKDESDEFSDKFFYQSEFISKEGICVISQEKIDLKFSRKHGLVVSFKKEIMLNNKSYFIYIF